MSGIAKRACRKPPTEHHVQPRETPTFTDRVTDTAIRGIIGAAMRLPYPQRIATGGWVGRQIAAPLAGWNRRIRDNLAYVMPGLTPAEVRRVTRGVTDNVGRAMLEMYSGPEFARHVRDTPFFGDGIDALMEAGDAGRPVLLVTGHFGSYDVPRAALLARGYSVGGLYNAMSNPLINTHYAAALRSVGGPAFPRDRHGMAKMLRHLKGGGMVGLIIDQHMQHGVVLDFMGKPARTALSAAELALKHDALVVPIYGIRRPDGLTFDILVEPPVPHGDPVEMTQTLNDSLSRLVRRHPEQWLWIHRRWKNVEPED